MTQQLLIKHLCLRGAQARVYYTYVTLSHPPPPPNHAPGHTTSVSLPRCAPHHIT